MILSECRRFCRVLNITYAAGISPVYRINLTDLGKETFNDKKYHGNQQSRQKVHCFEVLDL